MKRKLLVIVDAADSENMNKKRMNIVVKSIKQRINSYKCPNDLIFYIRKIGKNKLDNAFWEIRNELKPLRRQDGKVTIVDNNGSVCYPLIEKIISLSQGNDISVEFCGCYIDREILINIREIFEILPDNKIIVCPDTCLGTSKTKYDETFKYLTHKLRRITK